jgi:aryl-alcohol dehydrogenase-like predicted oxidoreductase
MKHRPLGRTGLMVSEIGFGGWGIGGLTPGATSYGEVDDAVSLGALRRALDLGVTFYDTSNLYGSGHSEELLGEAFGGCRDRVVIATKIGRSDYDTEAYAPEQLRASLEGSLRRLRSDYVDVVQVHSPSSIAALKQHDVMGTLGRLKAEGKVRAVGISTKAPAEGIAAIAEAGAQVVQVNFNLVDQRASEDGLLAAAERHGAGVVGRTPLCFGMLSGAVAPDTVFDARDHRSQWSKEQIARWIEASNLFVRSVAAGQGHSPVQVALRFCLSYPAMSTTIPGMLKASEVEQNVTASDLGPLSGADLAAIVAIYRNNDFFVRRRN